MTQFARNYAIRRAGPNDLGPLTELAVSTYVAAFGEGFAPADLAAHLESHLSPDRMSDYLARDTILVADREGLLLGYVQFSVTDADLNAEVRRLYVTAAVQRHGIGTSLMRATLSHLCLTGATRVCLDVWEDNADARRLYERFGFREIGRRPFVVASGRVTGYDLIMAKTSTGAD